MRSQTITATARLAGLDFDVFSEFDTTYVDDSFSHEFGVEKCGHDEIETVYPVTLSDPSDPRLFVVDQLARRHPARNRRHKKRVRQWLHRIESELSVIDQDSFWSYKELDQALTYAMN